LDFFVKYRKIDIFAGGMCKSEGLAFRVNGGYFEGNTGQN